MPGHARPRCTCFASSRLRRLALAASIADAFAAKPLRAALANAMRARFEWGWLAVLFILAHRSCGQGLRVLRTLASSRPSANL